MKKSINEYKYGNGSIFILSQTIKFIGQDLELRNILLLSSDAKYKLSALVYKQALLKS